MSNKNKNTGVHMTPTLYDREFGDQQVLLKSKSLKACRDICVPEKKGNSGNLQMKLNFNLKYQWPKASSGFLPVFLVFRF